ncbi:MAG: hypothetical protein LAP13_26400 [Acidobacteriia bacterium]|nr:hypothetical protein [Terriglobia bacterium]
MRRLAGWVSCLLLVGAVSAAGLRAQMKGDYLTDEEEDELREAQDPTARIAVYIKLETDRLDRFINFRAQPQDPQYDNGGYLNKLMGQYISLTDEMKSWIQDQYDRKNDMREGLRKFVEAAPKQLDQLRSIQQTPDAYARDYGKSLGDAIADLNDALNGATQALADQQKTFGELKREEKVEQQNIKERQKDAKKRAKEEKKLQKRERKKHPPTDEDED